MADFIDVEDEWLTFVEPESDLCGFVYRHNPHDYSAWNVTLQEEDKKNIETILEKYQTEGYSERNVFDKKFSEVFE